MTAESDQDARREADRAAERWLRRRGLPYFVPPGAWADRLFARVAPFLVFLALADVPLSGLLRIRFSADTDSPALALLIVLLVLVVGAAVVALPVAAAVVSAALLRRFPAASIPATVALLALCLAGSPVAARLTGSGLDPVAVLLVNAGAIALAYLFTWLGIGALLASAARIALRQLAAIGTLTTRALPILMLVVVFAFFSRPLWEVTSTMQPARLLAVGVFFVVLGLLFAVPLTRGEMRALDESVSASDRGRLVHEAGLPQLEPRANLAAPPLKPIEHGNLESVFVLALGFQVLVFALLTCLFLLVLGALAFSAEVLEEWVGGRATTVTLFGVDLPFTWALLKTAIFLSCVSSLNFLVSVTTNKGYRATFYDPLFHHARVALAVRAAYRGVLQPSGAPSPQGGAEGTTFGEVHAPRAGARHAALEDEDEDEVPGLFGVPEPGMVEPGRGSE